MASYILDPPEGTLTQVAQAEFRIFPDDCDAYGHLNQAALLRLFERARWEIVVTIGRDGRPVPVPEDITRALGARASRSVSETRQLMAGNLLTAVDVRGEGPPIVFIHGFPLDRTLWRQVAASLTGWRRIAPDLRGFGQTAMETGPATMGTYADDLLALLDTMNVRDAVVCGLSMGGYIAFELLRRAPERVRALVLCNTRATADDAEARAGRAKQIARVRRDGTAFLVDAMLPRLLAPATAKTMPDVVAQARQMMTAASADGVVHALEAMAARPDSTPDLPHIRVPTLVIGGREDALIGAGVTRAMADAIPDAHCTIMPDAGHLTPLEQPVNTSRLVSEFLEALK